MRSLAKHLWSEESGAIAAVYALALPALIAVGAIAFDYSRLASMDTELQNAADQAALAAVSQLDGGTDAIARATSAAQNMVVNKTLFANDGNVSGRNITVPTLVFYSAYNSATDAGTLVDSSKSVAIQSASAKFVQVTVGARKAVYALTPIVSLLNSGDIAASAVAGLGSGICQVPPLMFCAPTNDFPTSSDIGKGVRLQPGPTTGAWAPGDYGYLDFGNGASGLSTNLASNQSNQGCFDNSGGIQTEPGNKASVTKALNSRFDIYEPSVSACDPSTGDYCPAANVRKDFARKEVFAYKNLAYPVNAGNPNPPLPANYPTNAICGTTPAAPAATVALSLFDQNVAANGFTRDTCHIDSTCTTNFGNGTWGVSAYFSANHPSATVPTGAAATRYSVYKWELADQVNRMAAKEVSSDAATFKITGNGSNRKIDFTLTKYCAYPKPVIGTAVVASSTQKDRRVLQVASVDCTGLNGKSPVKVLQWVDVFLVEPSWDRSTPYATGKSQIYGEIIGVATKPDGGSAFQYYSRNRPYLIK
jgi:Flp pilus assembly protein TadG